MNKLQKEFIGYITYCVMFILCVLFGYAFGAYFFPTAISYTAPSFSAMIFGAGFNAFILFKYLGDEPAS